MNRRKILSNSEISAFCGQLSLIVKAGISLQEGLLIMAEDDKNGRGGEIIEKLTDVMEAGGSFAAALKESGEFPGYMVTMVEIGEASGKLEEVLESLRAYYERNDAVSRSIRSSVIYPLVMIVMMVAVILVIIIQVLPVFQQVFEQLGGEMSQFAQGLMSFGRGVSQYAVWIAAGLAVVAAGVVFLRMTKREGLLAALGAKLFRRLSRAVDSGRFASGMALMLSSGLDLDESVEMTEKLMEHPGTKKKIQRMKERMDSGVSFAEAAVETGLFSALHSKMLKIGQQTGSMDTVMHQIAEQYEEEVDRRISALISALEPTLVAVLSLIVGMILLSVMLPLMGIMSAIG
ncbi:MAG: type II secretion system F family protein [[Clostridium] leptum]